MTSQNNQRGFAAIETVLVVIAIALVVGVGAFVYYNAKKANDTLDGASRVANSSPTKSASKAAAVNKETTAKSAQKYLVIQEWGVQIPLTSSVDDAYYIIKNGSADLSLTSLKNTDCSATDTTLGMVTRFTATQKDSDTGKTYKSEMPNAVQAGSYFYDYMHPQAACSENSTVQARADAAMLTFKQQVDKLMVVSN